MLNGPAWQGKSGYSISIKIGNCECQDDWKDLAKALAAHRDIHAMLHNDCVASNDQHEEQQHLQKQQLV